MKKQIKTELENSLKKIYELSGEQYTFESKEILEMEQELNKADDLTDLIEALKEKQEATFIFFKILQNKVLENENYKQSAIYKICLGVDEKLTKQITQPLDSLIEHSINTETEEKTMALMVCFKYIDLENENKKLTLTDEQYKTWLETDITHINTEQFEILYGISKRKQADLRSHLKDCLPSFQIHGKGKHYYNKKEVEKWLENYKRVNPFDKK